YPHDATNVWKPEQAVLRAKAGTGIPSIEFGRAQAIRDTINANLRRAGVVGHQGVQLIARYGHQTLVGREPDLVRIALEKLHDGLPQGTAGVRQRDVLAVAPLRQPVGRAEPNGSSVVLVD